MNLNKYTFNGFKLYMRTESIVVHSTFEPKESQYKIMVQYKDGVPYKAWSQEILLDTKTNEEWDRWRPEKFIAMQGDKFIKNMSEEEVFGILL